MRIPEPTGIRRAGLLGAVGGALTVISGVVVRGIVQPASDVSDEMWSYPWSSDALVPVSLAYAAFHALVFIGVLGFARSGVAGPGRGARRYGRCTDRHRRALRRRAAVHPHRRPADRRHRRRTRRRRLRPGQPPVGHRVHRGGHRHGAGRTVGRLAPLRPLATGIWLAALVGLAVTPALAIGVTLYGLLLIALGVALWTQPTPSTPRPRCDALQVRL